MIVRMIIQMSYYLSLPGTSDIFTNLFSSKQCISIPPIRAAQHRGSNRASHSGVSDSVLKFGHSRKILDTYVRTQCSKLYRWMLLRLRTALEHSKLLPLTQFTSFYWQKHLNKVLFCFVLLKIFKFANASKWLKARRAWYEPMTNFCFCAKLFVLTIKLFLWKKISKMEPIKGTSIKGWKHSLKSISIFEAKVLKI